MKNKFDRCGLKYDEINDSVVNYVYTEPTHGKPGHYHLCLNCRKELINWLINR